MSQIRAGRTLKKMKAAGKEETPQQKAARLARKEQNRKYARAMKTAEQKENDARLHAAGAKGVEIMSDAAQSTVGMAADLVVPGSSSVVPVLATIEDRTIAYLAMGMVLRAIKKGLMQSQTTDAVPYYCFRYLVDAFTSCLESGVSLITEAPSWYWEIFHALKPKQVGFKTGAISYSWKIVPTGQSLDQVFELGTGTSQFAVFWGTGGSPDVINGFPVLGTVVPYTRELGLAAIAKLWNYAAGRESKLIPDPGLKCTMYNDTSAFSVVYPEIGASFFSVGAFRTTIYSERHIDSPILAKFAMYQPAGTPVYRGWQKAGLGAGSSSSVGPMWLDSGKLSIARTKFAPSIKFYNFDEIFETLSLTVATAMDNLTKAGQNVTICPLTSQEVQILLRQAILPQFDNDVFQDLRYDASENVTMLPFVVGPNGAVTGTVDMLLPTFLAENIRCMKKFSAHITPKFENSVITWYSVLGRPSPSEASQLGNYTFGGGTDVYSNLAQEVPINLIDVSAPLNQGVAYLDLTRTQIQQLKETWNQWITGLTAVLSPLVSVTGQKGIRVLNCNLNTLYADRLELPPPQGASAPATTEKKKAVTKTGPIGTSLGRLRLAATVGPSGSSYFQAVGERRVTSVEPIKPELWPFLSKWVLPVVYSDDTLGQTSAQALQTFLVEPNTLPKSSAGGIGSPINTAFAVPDSYTRHLSSAQIDCKAFATLVNNELIQDLINADLKGRGGFFSGLLADMIGTAIPDFAATAKAIGSMVPF
jgi:hypothetical protein